MTIREKFEIGDQVTDVRTGTTRGRSGQIIGLATLGGARGKVEPLYRIDFGRYELHLTADEIAHKRA